MITKPGRKPTIMETLLLEHIMAQYWPNAVRVKPVIHHVSEDSSERLQVEYELRWNNKCTFNRLILDKSWQAIQKN